MLIYNITFHLDESVHNDALSYLKKEYIPRAGSGGWLFNPRLCRIHSEETGHSYSIQFYVKNQSILNEWWNETGKQLQHDITIRFNNRVLGFSTILEELAVE